ncbi:hypothetical protein DL768_011066 [Monosporascus sp. mg162]|nr:hypothetical protein DL768_011066 [Monosporascus sp. mg162]
MAPDSGSNSLTRPPTSSFEHRFTVEQKDGDVNHEEKVVVLAAPFYRPGSGRTFFECRTESLPCCKATSEDRVKHEIQRKCDSLFQVGGWLEIEPKCRRLDNDCNKDYDETPPGEQVTSEDHNETPLSERVANEDHDEAPLSEHVTSKGHDATSLSEYVTSEDHDETPLSGHIANKDHDEAPLGEQVAGKGCEMPITPAEEYAGKYVTKVKKGLLKLGKASSKGGCKPSSYDVDGLLKCRQNAEADDDYQELENHLERMAISLKSEQWLADFYWRYMVFRRRRLDPAHSVTGDLAQERYVKDKETMCKVTSAVINRLETYWGVCANLIFNALRETKFKASFLNRVGKDQQDALIDSIVTLLLKIELEIKIPSDLLVINPAFFISVVTGKL